MITLMDEFFCVTSVGRHEYGVEWFNILKSKYQYYTLSESNINFQCFQSHTTICSF